VAQQNDRTRDSGVTIVTERRHHTVTVGVAIVILVLGAVVSDTANPYSTAKRIGVAAFFGVFIALCLWLWFRANRRRNHIEVADNAIRYVHWSGETVVEWRRAEVTELRLVRRLSDRKLFLYDRLVVPGTDAWLILRWFSSRAVRQACEARRWPIERA
jgi:hypothetical protein